MDINVFIKDTHDLYTTPLLQQTAYWSVVKRKLGAIPLAFEIVVKEKDIHLQKRTSARLSDDILIFTGRFPTIRQYVMHLMGPF